jgi:hypothetical protein
MAGEPWALELYLVGVMLTLLAARSAFAQRAVGLAFWQSPALAMLVAVTLASGYWLIVRG